MIHLLDDYYVKLDDGTYRLFRLVKGKTKTGQPTETEKIIGYYGTLKNCLKRCASELLEDEIKNKVVELNEAMKVLNNIEQKLERVFEREGL